MELFKMSLKSSEFLILLLLICLEGSLGLPKKLKSCKDKPDGPGCPSLTEAPTKPPVKIPSQAEWKEYSYWQAEFPDCNPLKNPNLSPVNVETKKAIPIKDEQTLMVYSGLPIKRGFFYSAEYNYDGVFIAAVNLGVRKENVRDATYIAGVGNPMFRYFQKAMFLFTSSAVEPERSLHQIDGKKFKLEVVLTFSDIPRSGQPPEDTTQIHVLVELSELITPNWSFLSAAVLRAQSDGTAVDSNENVELKKKVVDDATAALEKALEDEKKETGGDGFHVLYLDADKLYDLVRPAESLPDFRKKEKELKKLVGELTKEGETLKEEKAAVQTKMDALKEQIAKDIAAGLMKAGDENSNTDEVQRIFLEELQPAEANWTESQKNLKSESAKLWETSAKIKEFLELLEKNKIGKTIPGAPFKTMKELKQKRKEMKQKADEVARLKDDLENSVNSWEMEKSQAARDIDVDNPFQPSWLLPATGGYYRYNGSGVVPPCLPRTRVIVMEQPITISQAHFDLLSKYTNKGRTAEEISDDSPIEPMDKNIPILRPLGNRAIFYNKKNLQYRMDDGLHMKSKLRRQIKDKMRKSGQPSLKLQNIPTASILIILVTVLIM